VNRDAVPGLARATRGRARASRAPAWPRLLAHVDATAIEAGIEHADGRRVHGRRWRMADADALVACLRGYLRSTGESVPVAAIVVGGAVADGRFTTGAGGAPVAIERLRCELALRALHVVDERGALATGECLTASEAVRWLVAPARTDAATALCRLGSQGRAALLSPPGGAATASAALLSHPFAPLGEDEAAVVASMRARGLAPVFGNLLSTAGLSIAFEAIWGVDLDSLDPLPADTVAALALRDDRAARACAVVCAAIVQLGALLSFDGVCRLVLAGRAARLLAPLMARFPVAERLRAVGARADVGFGVSTAPLDFLAGASAMLTRARGLASSRPATPMERIVEHRPRLTASNQRVAALVLQDPALVAHAGIATIAAAARVSPSQVTRFCRALDFDGLVDFRSRLAASLAADDDARRGLSADARARSAGPA
jgi:glucokinase